MVGTFNNWQPGEDWRLQKNAGGAWEGCFDADAIKHGDLYKMLVRWQGGEGYRIPAYCNRVVQDSDTYLFNAEVYHPRIPYTQMHEHVALGNKAPFVYECHIGMSSEEGKVRITSYNVCYTKLLRSSNTFLLFFMAEPSSGAVSSAYWVRPLSMPGIFG